MPPYVNPISQPYGDIAGFQTPHIDNALNTIYQERKQKDALRAKQMADMDDDMNKEFGKIRSVDVPDFADKWNQYKQLRQKVLYDKKLQKDPKAYIQAKRDADIALGEVYRHGNSSKELLEYEKNKDEWAKAHPYEVSEDYNTHRTALRKAKVNEVGSYPMGRDAQGKPVVGSLTDDRLYVDNTPHYDFNKIITDAQGKPDTTYEEVKDFGTGGLQKEKIPYQYGAKPEQVRLKILSSFTSADPKTNANAYKTAARLGSQISDEDYNAVEHDFVSIPADELKRRGIKEVKPFPLPRNDAEKYANFATMQDALARNATRDKSQIVDDDAAKMALQHHYAKKLKEFEHDLKGLEESKQGIWLDDYIDNTLIKTAGYRGHDFLGKRNYEVNLSPIESKALTVGGHVPDQLKYDKEKNTFTPIYFKYDNKGNKIKNGDEFEVDEDLSVPLSREQFKLSLLNAVPKTPQATREMKKDPTIGTKKKMFGSNVPASTGTKTIKGF